MNWFKRKAKREEETEINLTNEEIKLGLKELIWDLKKEIVQLTAQEWVYLVNTIDPIKMGKEEANQKMAIVQQRIKNLKINLDAYQQYAAEHDIDLLEIK